jgi:hypothetical protein
MEAILMTDSIFIGVRNLAEANAALLAVEQLRRSQPATHVENPPAPSALDCGTAQRIFNALAWRKLPADYRRFFRVLLDAPEGEPVKVEAVAKKIGASSVGRVEAMTAKLTGRMKRFATPEEISNVPKPFNLLIASYNDQESHEYQLTAEGREAVLRYLGR